MLQLATAHQQRLSHFTHTIQVTLQNWSFVMYRTQDAVHWWTWPLHFTMVSRCSDQECVGNATHCIEFNGYCRRGWPAGRCSASVVHSSALTVCHWALKVNVMHQPMLTWSGFEMLRSSCSEACLSSTSFWPSSLSTTRSSKKVRWATLRSVQLHSHKWLWRASCITAHRAMLTV